jgi:hypothetical protein
MFDRIMAWYDSIKVHDLIALRAGLILQTMARETAAGLSRVAR